MSSSHCCCSPPRKLVLTPFILMLVYALSINNVCKGNASPTLLFGRKKTMKHPPYPMMGQTAESSSLPFVKIAAIVSLPRGGAETAGGSAGGRRESLSSTTKAAVQAISLLMGAQATFSMCKPAQAAKQFFDDDSPHHGAFLIRVLTANVATFVAWAVSLVLLNGNNNNNNKFNNIHRACLGLGIINVLDTLRTFVVGDIAKCGLIPGGQYFMLITPAIAVFAGWIQASWAQSYLKLFMGAYVLDGLVAANVPTVTAQTFFGPDIKLSDNTLHILKNTGWWILAIGVSGMTLACQVEPVQALGYGLVVLVLAQLDIMLRTNRDKRPLIFWILVDGLAAIAMLAPSSKNGSKIGAVVGSIKSLLATAK